MRRKILFVDDDVLAHWVTAEVLSRAGSVVTGVCRGAAAVKLLRGRPDFDLLLTDSDLPDAVTAIQVVARWRRALPGRPVVYVSHTPAQAGWLLDTEAFLQRPFSATALLQVVGTLLTRYGTQPLPARPARPNQHMN